MHSLPKVVEQRLILTANEDLLAVRQPSWVHALPLATGGVSIVVVAFFFFARLVTTGLFGNVVFLTSTLLGGCMVYLAVIRSRGTAFVVTNLRVIDYDRQGVFRRQVSEIPLRRIGSVGIQAKGITDFLAKTGTLRITVQDSPTRFEFRRLSRPEQLQQLITHELTKPISSNIELGVGSTNFSLRGGQSKFE